MLLLPSAQILAALMCQQRGCRGSRCIVPVQGWDVTSALIPCPQSDWPSGTIWLKAGCLFMPLEINPASCCYSRCLPSAPCTLVISHRSQHNIPISQTRSGLHLLASNLGTPQPALTAPFLCCPLIQRFFPEKKKSGKKLLLNNPSDSYCTFAKGSSTGLMQSLPLPCAQWDWKTTS